jgi:hypothetical protein
VCGAGLLCRNFWLFKKTEISGYVCRRWERTLRGRVWMSSWMALALWGLLRVVCVGGCGDARSGGLLLPGGREGNIPKVMKVFVGG